MSWREWLRLQMFSSLGISLSVHCLLLGIMAAIILPGIMEETRLDTLAVQEDSIDEKEWEFEELTLPDLPQPEQLALLEASASPVDVLDIQPGEVLLEGVGPGLFGGSTGGDTRGTAILNQAVAHGGKTGPIQITLVWKGRADLDLHVIPPSREKVYYAHPASRCGGELDVDMNNGDRNSLEPVENIVWTDLIPPRNGKYRVYVHHYSLRGTEERKVPFQVAIKIGSQVTVCEGEAVFNQSAEHVQNFQYGETSQSVPRKITPEQRATARLRLARAMLKRDQSAGRERLQELIRDFPGTPAAVTARELLENRD